MRPDDSTLDEHQHAQIRKHALKALQAADAVGCYPTPVTEVMSKAQVIVADEDIYSDGFLTRLRRRAGAALKSALSKVFGVLDVKSRIVYIDKSLHILKQGFLKLHETAHAVLPWQRDLYGFVEDCEKTISPEMSEQFDREANVFATEVLFQLDDFTTKARDSGFGIAVPIKLSKIYGASIYASIRRYVSSNHRACAVVVMDPPKFEQGIGFVASQRRIVTSPDFDRIMGSIEWPNEFTPNDQIGAMIPLHKRKMTGQRSIGIYDSNGNLHDCTAEAFTQTYQVFVLIIVNKSLESQKIFTIFNN
jgi:hypothetical protein